MTQVRAWLAALGRERGSITPFIIIMLPTMIGLAGFAYDAGMVFATRREANNVAAAAARAGANDIDVPSLYTGDPVLAATAPATAASFAANEGWGGASARLISDTEVEVSVQGTVDMVLLEVIGVGTQTVRATATAEMNDGP